MRVSEVLPENIDFHTENNQFYLFDGRTWKKYNKQNCSDCGEENFVDFYHDNRRKTPFRCKKCHGNMMYTTGKFLPKGRYKKSSSEDGSTL